MTEGRQPRESVRLSNPDIFSDDFALEPLGLIDGQRAASPDNERSHEAPLNTRRQSQSSQRTVESPTGSLRRSRGSQGSNGHTSISSRLADRTSQFSTIPRSVTSISDSGNTLSTQHRSVRTISTFEFPRAESPYQGATGPSQPYGMYSQDIGLTRNPSTMTASTIRRPERAYSGPSGPTQPYGMYAQNTVPEDDAALVAGLAPPILTGLSDVHQTYQRRLGPDGEDADDLIGPDGYTEQLPPYSRYANGVPPKYTSGLGHNEQGSASRAPLDDSQDSQETLTSPQARNIGLINPFGDSSTQLSSTASVPVPPKDEGGNFKERIQRKGKKKVCCGISCWLCIAMAAVVFLAVLLGGVVGGVVAHKRGEQKGMSEAPAAQTVTAVAGTPTATVTQSPPPDAISLSSTPSNLPPLPTGTFTVTLDEPTIVTNSCLVNNDQASAWDCATGAELIMEIQMTGPQSPMVSLSYHEPPNPSIRYGAQPPELTGQANLILMQDKYETGRGPAYLFAEQYNKTVIVHDSDIPGALPEAKRSFIKRWLLNGFGEDAAGLSRRTAVDPAYDSDWTSNSIAEPADKPWYCYWPGTILEGFIFVTQDLAPTASASAAYSGAAAATLAPSAPSQNARKRQTPGNLPTYPKVVKIEERRNPFNNIKPYCQQMQILNTNKPGPLADPATGQLVQVQLDESEPIIQHQFDQQGNFGQAAPTGLPVSPAFPTGLPGKRRVMGKRGIPGSGPSCQCEWMRK